MEYLGQPVDDIEIPAIGDLADDGVLRGTTEFPDLLNLGNKSTSQFNSVESLIKGAGKLSPVKGGLQGFVKGYGPSIFNAISQGGIKQINGTILMQDGTTLFNHFSTKTGVYTIDINKSGRVFKIRVK